MQGALAVTSDDVGDARLEQQLGHGHAGGADPDQHDFELGQGFPTSRAAFRSSGQHDHSGAVLVVVKDRDIQFAPQAPSISKQRGAAMSSRLMPPKAGEMALTTAMISSVSVVSRHSGQASMRRTP